MNARINWGILGCAGIAERALIPAIRESRNGLLFGIASRDEKKAQSWTEQFGIEKAYRDYETLIADPAIEAVYIPLPNHLHAEWSIRAAAAGKHVLCEKPMAMNAAEVRMMIAASEKKGTLLEEAFMYKFHPQIDEILELIRAGRIGPVRSVHSSFTFQLDAGSEDYRWFPEMGGGALYDVGCYTTSTARLVFGEEPRTVFARARFHPQHAVDVSASMLFEFSGGRVAQCDCAFDSQFQSRLSVVGEKGILTLDRAFSAKNFDARIGTAIGRDEGEIILPRANMYTRMVEDFADAILNDHAPRILTADAEGNMAAIDACFESIRTGLPVAIPAAAERL